MEDVYAVIMAGGVGSRFWPASRAAMPKQLLDLTGSKMPMITATVDRISSIIPGERVVVVTAKQTADAVTRALPTIPKENILAEPIGRNTAPCIGLAAIWAQKRNPGAVLAVMPSDHLIADRAQFLDAMQKAIDAARSQSIVTLGIKPDRPETGFGYIELGDGAVELRDVKSFREKPDLETAKTYVESGQFAWNSGIFFFTADRILSEIHDQMSELFRGLEQISRALGRADETGVIESIYPQLPAQSIDYGVMEGARNIKCIQVDFGWSDLGSWEAAYDLSNKDNSGNAINAEALAIDSRNCLVRGPSHKLIALVGVEDLVVIDTADSLLVCRKDRSQDVKKVVQTLEKQQRQNLL